MTSPASARMNADALDEIGLKKSERVYSVLKQSQSMQPVTLLYSMRILKNVFFWCLFYGYFAGIGGGLLIVTGRW